MRASRLAVAVLLLAALAGGCSDSPNGSPGDDPANTGTSSPSVAPSSVTPSPSVAPSSVTPSPTTPSAGHGSGTELPYPSGAPKTPSDPYPTTAGGSR